VVKALIGLGSSELAAMAAAENETEATCDFCGQRYYFSPQEVGEILGSAGEAQDIASSE